MSLLEQARALPNRNESKRGIYEKDLPELVDLAIAWVQGDIRNHQMGTVLKFKNDAAVGARCQYYVSTILKRGIAAGLVKVEAIGRKPARGKA